MGKNVTTQSKTRTAEILPMRADGLKARVATKADANGGGYLLTGYAVDEATHVRTPDAKTVRHRVRANSKEMLRRGKEELIGRIEDAIRKKQRKSRTSSNGSTSSGLFSDVFMPIYNKNPLCPELCSPNWCACSTKKMYLTYFRRNVLPTLDTCGYDATDVDLQQIYADCINKAARNKRGLQDAAEAQSNIGTKMQAAAYICERLRIISNDPAFPAFAYDIGSRSRPNVEQIKALPDNVRIMLAHKLFEDVGNRLSVPAGLMLYGGLRTAEAVAATFGELKIHDGYTAYTVLRQFSDGTLQDLLKTENGYRTIVLPSIFLELLKRRIEFLRTNGIAEESIQSLSVCASHTERKEAALDSALSAYLRAKLEECGFGIDTRAASSLIAQSPDYKKT